MTIDSSPSQVDVASTRRSHWNPGALLMRLQREALLSKIAWAVIACAACFLLLRAWVTAAYFDGQPIDGPFQLFNALERLHAGQVPWRDFTVFHGLGVLYVHYPFYVLFGHDLFSSEFARQLISPIAWIAAMTWLVYALTGKRRIVLCALALFCALSCVSSVELPSPGPLVSQPGNSLLALRWAYPVACGGFLTWAMRSGRISMLLVLASGAMFGLAPVWSFEQGLYVVCAAVLALGMAAIFGVVKHGIAKLVLFAAVATVVLWFTLSQLTGDATGLLKFVFSTIPQNQGWYFGAPPNRSISVNGFPVEVATIFLFVAVFFVATLTATRWLIPENERDGWLFGVWFLLAYFCFSSASLTGYLNESYLAPGVNALIAVTVGGAYIYCSSSAARVRRCNGLVLTVACLGMSAALISEMPKYKEAHRSARASSLRVSGVVPIGKQYSLAPLITRVAHSSDPSIFSTYRGLVEAAVLSAPVGRSDYIIHALGGHERRRYLDAFDGGHFHFVQTLRPTFTNYEEWLQNSHWDFYRHVIEYYSVVEKSDFTVLWQRRPKRIVLAARNCHPLTPDGDGRWFIDAIRAPFVELTIDYEARNALSRLPIVNGLPRYLIEFSGLRNHFPLSLNPAERRATWLISNADDVSAWIMPKARSILPGATLSLHGITACELMIPDDTLPAFTHLRGL